MLSLLEDKYVSALAGVTTSSSSFRICTNAPTCIIDMIALETLQVYSSKKELVNKLWLNFIKKI